MGRHAPLRRVWCVVVSQWRVRRTAGGSICGSSFTAQPRLGGPLVVRRIAVLLGHDALHDGRSDNLGLSHIHGHIDLLDEYPRLLRWADPRLARWAPPHPVYHHKREDVEDAAADGQTEENLARYRAENKVGVGRGLA
jgi:hypothetical protein